MAITINDLYSKYTEKVEQELVLIILKSKEMDENGGYD